MLFIRCATVITVLFSLFLNDVQAQLPVITGFNPASGRVGAIVTITGSNFNTTPANNIVFFGAVKATVSSATASTLTIVIPAGASYAPFTVLNTASHLSGSSSGMFRTTFLTINNIQSSHFDPAAVFNSGPTEHSHLQQALLLDDFDGDGKVDIMTTNVNTVSGQGMYVFRNTTTAGTMTNASYSTAQFIATGDNNSSTAFVSDIDGDGKNDILINNMNLRNKQVYRNTSVPGTISFAPAAVLPIVSGAWGVEDVDGDGKPDIVSGSTNTAIDSIFVFRNQSVPGTISFTAPVFTNRFLMGYVTNMTFKFFDLDGDGKKDLLYPGNLNTGSQQKWCAVTHRNTSTPGNISLGSQQISDTIGGNVGFYLRVGDFDGDGKPDMAGFTGSDYVVPANADKLILWRNVSTGPGNLSFATAVSYGAGLVPYGAAVEDFDGDGKDDIITINGGGRSVSVFKNKASSGNFTAASFDATATLLLGYYPAAIAAGDVDGDGKPDIVCLTGDNKVVVFRNNPPPVIKNAKSALCKGDDTKMYIISEKAGISSYQWEVNTGSGFTTLSNNATYTGVTADTLRIANVTAAMHGYVYRLKDVNNAQNKISWNTDTLKAYDPPAVPVLTRNNNVLSTTGVYASYQWFLNNVAIPGATGATYATTQPGSYTLRVSNIHGCQSNSAAIVIDELSVRNAHPGAAHVNIYPNPATDYVNITAPFPVNVVVADVTGRRLQTMEQAGRLSLADWSPGIYLISITDKDGRFIKAERITKYGH